MTDSPEANADRRAWFRARVEEHQHVVHRLLSSLIADRAEAEDLAQEVFLACWRGRFDASRGSFRTWALTIARNRATNWLRARRPQLEPEPERLAASGAREELREELERAFAALPAEQRSAFHLAEIEGLPLEEVARIEGAPVGTVKSRLHRARRRLRELLRTRHTQ